MFKFRSVYQIKVTNCDSIFLLTGLAILPVLAIASFTVLSLVEGSLTGITRNSFCPVPAVLTLTPLCDWKLSLRGTGSVSPGKWVPL